MKCHESNRSVVTLTLDGGVGSSLKMAAKRSLMADIVVVARSTGTLNAGYAGNVLFDRTGSTIYINGSSSTATVLPAVYEDSSAWSCWAIADSGALAANIQCSGSAGQTVRFVATVRTAEVQWENAATPLSSAAG